VIAKKRALAFELEPLGRLGKRKIETLGELIRIRRMRKVSQIRRIMVKYKIALMVCVFTSSMLLT
jgi:hypothetical protein